MENVKITVKDGTFTIECETFVHAFGESEYTLCGISISGDDDLGVSDGIDVNEKVTCPRCIETIKYCKTFRKGRDY